MGMWWRAVGGRGTARAAALAVPAQQRLRRRVEQAAVSVSGAVVVAVDVRGRLVYVNAAAEQLSGYAAADLLGRCAVDVLLPRDQAPQARALFAQVLSERAPARHELDWLTRDGGRRRLVLVNTVLQDRRGRAAYVVSTGIDVTAERQAQQLSHAVLAATTEQAMIAVDTGGRITLFNAGAERMLGHTAQQAVGRDVIELLHDPAELAERARALGLPVENVIAAAAQAGGAETRTWTYRRRDGSRLTVALSVTPLRSESGHLHGYLGVAVDVTAQQAREQELHRAAARAAHLAAHDALTGLPNRTVLLERLQHALAALQRHDRRSGLLFLDVDRLKDVNDAHGHAAGDALLVAVASRLTAASRGTDLCARLSGDEFAVLLEDIREPGELERAAERIRVRLAQPLELPGGGTTTPTASIGTALVEPGDSADAVLARADSAMYGAKAQRLRL